MNIIIKFTLRNMKEKKFRLVLILVSIVLSTALFFASSAVGENIEKIYATNMRSFVGTSDIQIMKNGDDLYDQLFYAENFEKYADQTDYIVGGIYSSAIYETDSDQEVNMNMIGFSIDAMEKYNPIDLLQHLDEPFEGKKLVISYTFAEEHGYKLGDTIKLNAFGDSRYPMEIWGIANGSGIFRPANEQVNVLMPDSLVSKMLGVSGKVYTVFMKTSEGNTQALIEQLREDFPGYDIVESMPEDEIKEAIAMITTLFRIMLILVIFISVFIIYTSFKVIIMERLPVIGTFRSVGATKRSTNFILLGESTSYGIVGGLIGFVLGLGILYLMTSVMAYDPWSGTTMDFELTFSPFHFVSSMVMAVGLSLVSSLIPVLRVNKISVKDIVLNKIEQVKKVATNKNYIGLVLLGVFSILPKTGLLGKSLPLNILCMILAIIGLIMTVPLIIKGFIFLLDNLFGAVFGNEGALAVKNINNNKNVVNNIILLTIGIASLFMINVISYSVGVEALDAFRAGDFDIWAYISEVDDNKINRIKVVEGVEDVNGVYVSSDVDIKNSDTSFAAITGVNPYKYFEFWRFDMIGDKKAAIDSLDSGRHMIINQTIAKVLNVDVGDTLTLDVNGTDKTYGITGMFSSIVNDGRMGIISDKYFKLDFGGYYYSDVYIKTSGDPELVNEALVDKFKEDGIWSRTKAALQEMNRQSNNQILSLLQGFSILTMVIGVFGVFNNYLVNMMSRKRSLAMFRSVGMSMKQMRKMLFLESFSGGLIGGLSGVVGGLIFVLVVGYVIESMNTPLNMHISPILCIQSVLGGIAVAIIASVSPVLKSSKMKIIEAVKYE